MFSVSVQQLLVLSAFVVLSQLVQSATLVDPTELSSSSSFLAVTLTVDQYRYVNSDTGVTYLTRLYNAGSTGDILSPGPTIRVKRGDTLNVTLVNNLGPETQTYTDLNDFHYANYTNLHTHGLHIHANNPGDNVLLSVAPGETWEYSYNLPADHQGGTFWYHAHHHGSTANQVSGGLVGAIIVDDASGEVPDAIYNMDEQILLINQFNPSDLINRYPSTTGDALAESSENVVPANSDFYLVNGMYQPSSTLTAGKWVRLRVIYSALVTVLALQMDTNTADCEWYLLAKDGVYVATAPRTLTTAYMAPGNRADIVLRCNQAGSLILSGASDEATQATMISFTVATNSGTADEDLPVFNPYRPQYLADVYDFASPTEFSLNFARANGGCSTNDVAWDGGTTALEDLVVGSVQKWTVRGEDRHPFHLHVNSFQLQGVTDASGYYQEGDWHDVVYEFDDEGVSISAYYFAVDDYLTKTILHCHFLPHEDQGCMGILTHSGASGDSTGLTGQSLSCTGDSLPSGTAYTSACELVTSAPSLAPTEAPSVSVAPTQPTATPTNEPTQPTAAPTEAPTIAPTIAPTNGASSSSSSDGLETYVVVVIVVGAVVLLGAIVAGVMFLLVPATGASVASAGGGGAKAVAPPPPGGFELVSTSAAGYTAAPSAVVGAESPAVGSAIEVVDDTADHAMV